MRISVSNLAWGAASHASALTLLSSHGVEGVEVAPTRIADWKALSPERLRAYRSEIEGAGLRVSSLQAIFFGRAEAKLLSDETAFRLMSEAHA